METRERITTAALGLFSERGYASASIDDIAESAGVTKGAFYYWFTDKHDLGRDLQHDLYGRLTTLALSALNPEGDAVTNMRRAFQVYLQELGSLGEARFFLRDAWTIPELDEGGRRDHMAAVELVRDFLQAAIDRGEMVALDADALARVLLGAWAEATLHVLTTGQRAPTVAVVEHLIDSLRTPAPHPPRRPGAQHRGKEPVPHR
jgi:AcrR family transcriptional regulator